MFKKKNDSVKPYYKYLNINPLKYQIKIQGKLLQKLINDKHPKWIKDKFPLKRSAANNQSKFIVPFYKTTIAISSLSSQSKKV